MLLALHRLHNSLVDTNPCMIQRVVREDTWEQRMTMNEERTLAPLIDGQVFPMARVCWIGTPDWTLNAPQPSHLRAVERTAGRDRRTRDGRADLL